MAISAIAYFTNTLDNQSPGRDRVRSNYLKVGDLFYKICTIVPHSMPIFEEKKSHPIRPVEGLKLYLDFLQDVSGEIFFSKIGME